VTKVSDVWSATDHGPSGVVSPGNGRRAGPVDPVAYLDEHPQSWNLLLEALPDGTALLDAQGVMRYVNEALARISGYSRYELLGQSVMLLVPPSA